MGLGAEALVHQPETLFWHAWLLSMCSRPRIEEGLAMISVRRERAHLRSCFKVTPVWAGCRSVRSHGSTSVLSAGGGCRGQVALDGRWPQIKAEQEAVCESDVEERAFWRAEPLSTLQLPNKYIWLVYIYVFGGRGRGQRERCRTYCLYFGSVQPCAAPERTPSSTSPHAFVQQRVSKCMWTAFVKYDYALCL